MGSGLPFPRHPHSVLPGLGETPLKGVGAPPQVSESGDRLLPWESQRKTQSPWQGESPFWKPQAWAKGNEAWIQGVCWGGGESSDPWKSQAHLSKPLAIPGGGTESPGSSPFRVPLLPPPHPGRIPCPLPKLFGFPKLPQGSPLGLLGFSCTWQARQTLEVVLGAPWGAWDGRGDL